MVTAGRKPFLWDTCPECKAVTPLQMTHMGLYDTHMGSTNELARQVAARVRAAIETSEYSSRHVADLTGIPRETLRRRLNDLQPFSIDEIELVARCLGIDPDAFLESARWTEAS